MAGKSPIEWTEHTWNPIVGCSLKSPGCKNCYAMPMARRLELMGNATHYTGLTDVVKGKAVFNGTVHLAPEKILLEPLKRKKPTTYFVNSMGDLFHENVPDEWIDRVFAVMALCPQHTFQVLTKRADRMRAYLTGGQQMSETRFDDRATCIKAQAFLWGPLHRYDDKQKSAIKLPLPNVWLGVSTERQQEADERIPLLLQTPAAIRFISAEPLLGPIDLRQYLDGHEEHGVDFSREVGSKVGACIGYTPPLDWVIVGGESGPDARPMHPQWARALRDQCDAAGMLDRFFFKQWGAHIAETVPGTNVEMRDLAPNQAVAWGDGKTNHVRYTRVGKKAAGRLLDGKEHNGFPIPRTERAA